MSATALRIVEGSSMDKTKALSAALSQIERQFGKGLVMELCWIRRSSSVTEAAWRGSVVRIQSSLLQPRRAQNSANRAAIRSTQACGCIPARAAAWSTDWLCSSIPMRKWT